MTRQRLIPTLVAITALLVMGLPAAASAKKAVKVTTGEEHVCALKPNGKVLCWGENDYGQADPPGSKFKAIDGGAYHTCGIKLNGRVKCWGYDSDYGETKAPSGKFKSISAGYEATCGIKANGKAKCWGYDGYGQVSGPNGKKLKSISAGVEFTCGRKPNDKPVCWGDNIYGQVDFGKINSRFKSVLAGSFHACGVKSNGKPVCHGHNSGGETIVPDKKVKKVYPGYYMTCIHMLNQKVRCRGTDYYGITHRPNIKLHSMEMDSYSEHACGVKLNKRSVICWGSSDDGQDQIPPSLK